MLRTFKAAATLCGVLGLACPAEAATLVLSSPYDANLIWNNNGTVSPISDPSADYTAVQQQSELWWNFSSGSGLPAGALVTLSFSTVDGDDHHTISFVDSSFGTTGGAFTWGYDVSEVPSFGNEVASVAGGIFQTTGTSTLVTSLTDNNSNSYGLNITQIGAIASGVTTATFLKGVTSLAVSERLTLGMGGSDVTGISNSFTENAIPEPSSWAMVALGFVGLGFVGYRKARSSRTAFSEA